MGIRDSLAMGAVHGIARHSRTGEPRFIVADVRLAPGNSGGPSRNHQSCRVTRIAIVAESEEIRAALAAALGASAAFEIVSVGASTADISPAADVVVNARDATLTTRTANRGVEAVSADPPLTNRERQVLGLLADGLGNKQIAARLGISANTVKTHLELLFDKLAVSSRTEAVATAARRGLLLL